MDLGLATVTVPCREVRVCLLPGRMGGFTHTPVLRASVYRRAVCELHTALDQGSKWMLKSSSHSVCKLCVLVWSAPVGGSRIYFFVQKCHLSASGVSIQLVCLEGVPFSYEAPCGLAGPQLV